MSTKYDLKKIEKISKALGDPYRLSIVDSIRKQKDWMTCTCILGNYDLAQSTMSHHLKQLVDADILVAEKDGRNARYLINQETMEEYVKYLASLTQ